MNFDVAVARRAAEEGLIVAAGGGLDVACGGRAFSQILQRLLDDASTAGEGAAWWSDLEVTPESASELVEVVSANLGADRVLAALWRDNGNLEPPADLATAISLLPATGAVNLSWSDALAECLASKAPTAIARGDDVALPQALRDDTFALLSPWGTLATGDVLLTDDHLRMELGRNSTLRRVLTSLWESHVWLFVGVAPSTVVEWARMLGAEADDRRHMAFCLAPDLRQLARARLDLAGIDVVPLDHEADLAGAIDAFGEAVRRHVRPEDVAAQTRRLVLENIGPFPSLELDIAGHWVVLLGDNASGKTTVLRALALVLAGDDALAGELGETLLRADALQGSISLELGNDRLSTKLTRKPDGVEVRASGISPVQSGDMLAIAFPAVRGAIKSSLEASRPESGPSVRDLVPLLRGPLDGRLHSVEAWFDRLQDEGDEEAIEELFRTIATIAPGFPVTFDHVTPDGTVLVRTPDGVLPLSALSQGVGSLLGWIGTVIRRLTDLDKTSDSSPAFKLVIVDELDAHLHPRWQRLVPKGLIAAFPDVSFVLSTHAPLVLSSVTDARVIRLEREGAMPPCATDGLASYARLRADQVLTSDAFELDSTRSPVVEDALERLRLLDESEALNPDEERERNELAAQIEAWLPPPYPDPIAREAEHLVEELTRLVARVDGPRRAEAVAMLRRLGGEPRS